MASLFFLVLFAQSFFHICDMEYFSKNRSLAPIVFFSIEESFLFAIYVLVKGELPDRKNHFEIPGRMHLLDRHVGSKQSVGFLTLHDRLLGKAENQK